jgi:hypothetical protein
MKKRFPENKSTQIITELAGVWKTLTDAEKAPYFAKAHALKKKYDDDKAKWRAENPIKKVNTGPPKKPSSSYIIFSDEKRAEVSRQLPLADLRSAFTHTLTHLSLRAHGQVRKQFPTHTATQLVVELAKIWHELSEAEKAPYVIKARQAKEDYEKAKTEWDLEHPPVNDPDAPPRRPLSAFMMFSEEKRAEVRPAVCMRNAAGTHPLCLCVRAYMRS